MSGRILVVDDEPDVASAWARALRLAQHTVHVSSDSVTALVLSKTHPLDLVIVDFMMPSKSGLELLNDIRKDHPFIRSVLISGKLDSTVSETDVQAEILANVSVDAYIHKPIDNQRLLAIVNDLLEKKPETTLDWSSIAASTLQAPRPKREVKAAEQALKRRRTKRK